MTPEMTSVQSADGTFTRDLNPQQLEEYRMLQGILQRHGAGYLDQVLQAEGRQGVRQRLRGVADTSRGAAFRRGGVHGFTHGFSDDMERAGSRPDSMHGQRLAREHIASQYSHPVSFALGQITGGALFGAGTRFGVTQGARGVRAALPTRLNREVPRIPASQQRYPQNAAMIDRREEILDRWQRLGAPTEKTRAFALDGLHGAVAGYGGYDVTQDEELLSGERLGRAAAGGAVGAGMTPIFAGMSSGLVNTGRKLAIDGGMPIAPRAAGYTAEFIDGPEQAMARAIGQDEFVRRSRVPVQQEGPPALAKAPPPPANTRRARRAAADAQINAANAARRQQVQAVPATSVGRMNPVRGTASVNAPRAEAPRLSALVDHVITEPGVSADLQRRVGIARPRQRAQFIERMADAPGGGFAARDMFEKGMRDANASIDRTLTKALTGLGKPANVNPTQQRFLSALLQAFDAGDYQVADDWQRVAGRHLTPDGMTALRQAMVARLQDVFRTQGPDALLQRIGGRETQEFMARVGLGDLAQTVLSARNGDEMFQRMSALAGPVGRAVGRDSTKSGVPRVRTLDYAHSSDVRRSRLPLRADQASDLASRVLPGGRGRRPIYAPPENPATARPMLRNTPVTWGGVLRRAGDEARLPLIRKDADYSETVVNVGGMLSTGAVMQIEMLMHEYIKLGMSPDEARRRAEIEFMNQSNSIR